MRALALQDCLNPPVTYDYIRNPEAIYAESFRLIRQAVDLSDYDPATAKLVERLVHTNGRPDIVDHLAIHDRAISAGVAALKAGAPVFCDAEMVRRGIIQRMLPAANELVCTLDQVPYVANADDTRSARAVEVWAKRTQNRIEGSIVAIGNAPTALYRLLERMKDGTGKPALLIGMPVGFVGAAQSKQALLDDFPDLPSIVLKGREGGSAYAAAAVNALSGLAK